MGWKTIDSVFLWSHLVFKTSSDASEIQLWVLEAGLIGKIIKAMDKTYPKNKIMILEHAILSFCHFKPTVCKVEKYTHLRVKLYLFFKLSCVQFQREKLKITLLILKVDYLAYICRVTLISVTGFFNFANCMDIWFWKSIMSHKPCFQ